MSKDELKVYIINYIKYHTAVSFVDLEELNIKVSLHSFM